MKFISICVLFAAVTAASPRNAQAQTAVGGAPARSARPAGQPENRWRYVWHNDRWWYWSANESWSYFAGRRWRHYDPRRPPADALAAGYRKAPAFEKPPAAPPRPPMSLPGEAIGSAAGMVDLFDLGGAGQGAGMHFGGSLPALGGGRAGGSSLGTLGGAGGARGGAAPGSTAGARTGSIGGGGFGGPAGGSLGAGSAAGGASSPQ